MNGFSILMFIFAICVLLVGLYMYTGHKLNVIAWRAPYKNLKISDWQRIGKYTMLTSIFILAIALIGLIFKFN